MSKSEKFSDSYYIKRYTSSSDPELVEALKIYNDVVAPETKTSIEEITAFVDLANSGSREMYFFGLYYNSKIVGYFQCGYLNKTKTLIIDYMVFKNDFNYNSIFFPLFSLVQRYFSDNLVDIDYYVMEISIRTLEENVDKESYYSRKWLTAEDFRLVNTPYPQPKLGFTNIESNFDLRLMIKSSHPIGTIKSDTFISIVSDIYNNHYIDWYKKFMNQDEIKEYQQHITEQLNRIETNLKGKTIIELNNSNIKECEYFLSEKCCYNNAKPSTAGFAPNTKGNSKRIMCVLAIIIIIFISLVLSICIHIIVSKLNIINDSFSPVFNTVSSAITGLIVFFFSIKKD